MHLLFAGGGGRDKADLIAPAVVIPWRDEGDRGESLRYTLRGLVNLPHGSVVVAGDQLPEWAAGGLVNVIVDKKASRFDDAESNVRAALETVTGWAYILHDDMVVARPVAWIAPANRGVLSSYRGGGAYYQRARHVDAWLRRQGIRTPVNFNVHLPFLVNAGCYLETTSNKVPSGFGLSVYGNLMGLKTRTVIDPKVTTPGSRPHPSWPVWSMSDRSFKTGLVGRMVRDGFPTPGPYET